MCVRRMLLGALAIIAASGLADSARGQDPRRPETVPQLDHFKDITSIAFTPDGRFLLSGSEDNCLYYPKSTLQGTRD